MNRALRLTCLIALPLALSACGKDKEPEANAEAAGEILPGSIDDAMLPMDTVRSQPPLAPPSSPTAKGGAAKDTADAVADEAGTAAEGDAAPTVSVPPTTPAPTPSPAAKAPTPAPKAP